MPTTLESVEEKVQILGSKFDKVIDGIYGTLECPGSGFINEMNRRFDSQTKQMNDKYESQSKLVEKHQMAIEELLGDKKDRKNNTLWAKRFSITTSISTLVGIMVIVIKTFFFTKAG